MKPDGMIDIETLSTKNDAAIIAIGLVAFDPDDQVEELPYGGEILINPALALGHRDPATLEWWKSQDPLVCEDMHSGILTPKEACLEIQDFFAIDGAPHFHQGVKHVWANSPQFDFVILRNLFDLCKVEYPWHFRDERDFRTLAALAKKYKIDYQAAYAENTKHDAMSDAFAQAAAVQIILSGLSSRNERVH